MISYRRKKKSRIVLFLMQAVAFSVLADPVDEAVMKALADKPKEQLAGILGSAFTFPSKEGKWMASIVVRLPSYRGKNEKGFLLAFAAYNDKAETLEVTTFDIPPGSLAQPLLLYEVLISPAPIHRIAWYVRNNDLGTYTTQESVDLPEKGPLGSFLLSPGMAGTLAPLYQNRGEEGKARGTLDPLAIDDGLFPIFPLNVFNAPESLYTFFTLATTEAEAATLQFKMAIQEGSETFPAPLFNVSNIATKQEGLMRYFGSFDTLGFTEGEYTAVLTVENEAGEVLSTRSQTFQIIWQ
jgi:hypothetical protein